MNHDDVRDLLVRTSELPAERLPAPVGKVIARARSRRRRRRAGLVTAVAAGTAVAVAVPLSLVGPSRRLDLRVPGSAADLAAGNWSVLPNAPFPELTPSVAVWSGQRLYVWSGEDPRTDRVSAHVAAYDPASRAWERLPDPPLAARMSPSMIWTGSQLVVWGGRQPGDPDRHDGARYDPRSRTWQPVAAAPASLAAGIQWQSAWVRGLAVLGDNTGTGLAGYDPVRDTWTTLAPVPALYGLDNAEVTLIVAGNELYAISLPGKRSGLAVLRYDWAHRGWVPPGGAGTSPRIADSVLGDAGQLNNPLWDGREVLLTAQTPDCAAARCARPPVPGQVLRAGALSLRVVRLPARSTTATDQPKLGGIAVWTGRALVADTYIWDPGTGIWRDLPDPPRFGIRPFPDERPGWWQLAYRVWAGSGLVAVYPTLVPGHTREDGLIGWLAG